MEITNGVLKKVFKEDINEGTLFVPEGVSEISTLAISFLNNLNTLVLSSSVEKIDDFAITNNAFLTKIMLSKNIKYIGNFAFNNCTNLREISIPKSVLKIGDGAFFGCSSLNKIEIKGTTEISKTAFKECPSVQKIVLYKNLNLKNLLSFENPDAKIEFENEIQK